LVQSTDIFNYFTSLFGGPHTAIEEPLFLVPKNIKAFNKAVNQSKFRGCVVIALDTESGGKPKTPGSKPKNIIVGFHIREDITLVLTKFGYLHQEKELVRKRRDNIDYILSCCVYDLEIVLAEMKDKSKTRMMRISPEAPRLKALMTEVLFVWADAFKISWGN
uniref:Uncharacterized protein n=1 Tax=Romanomermis culicivorax TaxID=13658 RepID=A0A915JW51_ROMCU